MEHIEKFLRIASMIGFPVSFDNAKILDFGCGSGTSVVEARAAGLDVFGCDIADGLGSAPRALVEEGVLRTIDMSNYEIPFKEDEFDMVVSHQVLEHVQNYDEVLLEIRRVLKAGGVSIHIFSSRYTPIEPHAYVPLATIVRSMSWLKFWAYLGIRNEYQKALPARKVAELNHEYLHTCTNYLTKGELRRQMSKSFATVLCVEREYLAAGKGYGPKIVKLPFLPYLFGALIHKVIALA